MCPSKLNHLSPQLGQVFHVVSRHVFHSGALSAGPLYCRPFSAWLTRLLFPCSSFYVPGLLSRRFSVLRSLALTTERALISRDDLHVKQRMKKIINKGYCLMSKQIIKIDIKNDATETIFSYLRLLRNDKVSTLLTSATTFFR